MSNTKIILKNNVRIYVSDYTSVAQTAIEKHETLPLASLTLATAIVTFAPLAVMKKQGKVSTFFEFNGPLKNISVQSNAEGDIRALIGNPKTPTDFDDKDPNAIPIKVGTGEVGSLKVIHQYLDNTFGGEVKMANGDMVTDLAFYLDQSEQINSAVVADVRMKDKFTLEKAVSVIFQMLPGHTEEDIIWVENFIKNNKLSKNSNEEYINKIDGKILDTKEVRWNCGCTKEQMKKLIELIEPQERKEIIEEIGFIEIICNFCNTKYKY